MKHFIYIYTLKLSSIFGIGKKSDYFWAMVYIETGFCIFFSYDHAAPWEVLSCLFLCPSVRLSAVCRCVCRSACLSVCLSLCPSVCLSDIFHNVPLIISSWTFMSNCQVMYIQNMKVRFQRSRSQTSSLACHGYLRTVTPIWIYRCLHNGARKWKWHKKCAKMFFKVTQFADEIMHKFWGGNEDVPYCFLHHPSNFEATPNNRWFDTRLCVSGR